jgi:flagellar basal body P-ring formation protein FlgA
MPSVFRHALWVVALGAAGPAGAQTFHSLEDIEEQVVASLGAQMGEPGGPSRPIDRRLRLQRCPAPIIVEPVNLGAVTVRCQQIGWRIRVPVLQAREELQQTAAAAPVRTRAPRAEPVVRRGDPVALVVVSGGFTVSRQAVAEQDGAPGDRIRVRTEPRAAPVVGQVLPDGRVAMTGFN